jgi:hypothetical protein
MRLPIAMLAFALAIPAPAQDRDNAWMQMAGRAVQQSKLTLPGSKPFHLRVEIVERTDPTSDYQAKVEEYWVSPEKWQRTIESPAFSQTTVVNGDKFLEKDTGDYFPWWLDDLVTAMFDPLPNVAIPNQISSQPEIKFAPRLASLCTSVQIATDRWSLCFDPRRTLLTSAFNLGTGYDAEFKDFKEFGNKQVPRQIVSHPEPGMTIQATITQLVELRQADEQVFAIDESTPPQNRITRVRIDQETLRKLSLTSTEIDWPMVGVDWFQADAQFTPPQIDPGTCAKGGLEDVTTQNWKLLSATW